MTEKKEKCVSRFAFTLVNGVISGFVVVILVPALIYIMSTLSELKIEIAVVKANTNDLIRRIEDVEERDTAYLSDATKPQCKDVNPIIRLFTNCDKED